LLRRRGQTDTADRLEREAVDLRARFNRDFWMEDLRFYAQALDGNKRHVRSITSNPGHCIWSGICDLDKAHAVATRLMERDMFSGWGLRTLSTQSPNFNPMSYHNGSVWPHDTSIIALGLRRLGRDEEAIQLVAGVIEAGFRFDEARLPELFCGFPRDRRFNSSPAAYIVSCSPQAWAAGCVFMLLQSMLDLRPDVGGGAVYATPLLPSLFTRVELKHMRVGRHRVDLRVDTDAEGVHVQSSRALANEFSPVGAG